MSESSAAGGAVRSGRALAQERRREQALRRANARTSPRRDVDDVAAWAVPTTAETVDARATKADGDACGCDHAEVSVPEVAIRIGHVSAERGYASVAEALRGLRGREAAKVRRQLLCVQGRGDLAACRPTGRTRRNDAVPPKVEEGTTLAGTRVTGTQVELTASMTGADAGSCRVISGTQYVGVEQFEERCGDVPEAPPAKVAVGRTAAGRRVSGTSLAPRANVTGAEAGTCQRVTGVDYLEADAVEDACGITPEPASAKVTVSETVQGQRVTGVAVDRPAPVTGDDVGRRQRVTGSQYQHPEWIRAESRNGSSVPHKVSVMSTVRGRPVTGTIVTPDPGITGADRGACVEVTGTEYEDSLAKYQACNRQPAPGPHKVSVMRTWRGEVVTGTTVEQDPRVTGDEAGRCEDVTGTPYVGPDQYQVFCATDPVRQAASDGASIVISGTRVSGSDRVTGDERGAMATVSGTPYQRGAVEATERGVGAWGATFSITTPARVARERAAARVTGTGYQRGSARITGPLDLALGLVSGTPEFRYHAGAEADDQVPTREATVTGEGREQGFAITGDAWDRSAAITGTEGASAWRNPTLRGTPRRRGQVWRSAEERTAAAAELPASARITGSTGGVSEGPVVTFSGGSRG